MRGGAATEVGLAVARMCGAVREALRAALNALQAADPEAAAAVVAGDAEIDRLEEEIERLCLRLLGSRRHAGADEREVRAIAAAFKVVTDLERVGDHASAIARTTLRIQGEQLIPPFIDIQRLGALAGDMLDSAAAAFAAGDAARARTLAEQDDGVDALYDQVFRELVTYMLDDRTSVRQATHLLFVANALERIADHATNLCEWIIFAETGHRLELND